MARKEQAAQEPRWLDPAEFATDFALGRVAGQDEDGEPGALPNERDPVLILRAIMNDPSWEMAARVDAARALLPYFHASWDDDEDEDCSRLFDDDAPPLSRQQLRVAAAAALLPLYYSKMGPHEDKEAGERVE